VLRRSKEPAELVGWSPEGLVGTDYCELKMVGIHVKRRADVVKKTSRNSKKMLVRVSLRAVKSQRASDSTVPTNGTLLQKHNSAKCLK